MNFYNYNLFCRIYGFRDTESVRIRTLSVFGHFPLTLILKRLSNSLTYFKYIPPHFKCLHIKIICCHYKLY